jgi:hypothetical protein
MRIRKRAFAVVLVLFLSMPASAAGRPSSGPGSIIHAVKRFVIRAISRIGTPGGSPIAAEPDEPPPVVSTTT